MKTKLAIVTGANRGMGRAVSEKLASLNIHVVMVGKNKAQLDNEVKILRDKNLSVEPYALDLQNESATNQFIKYISEKHGYLDILINNAGIYIQEDNHLSLDEDIMKKTFEINTHAPYRLMKGLLPLMFKHGYGRIVNVSSGLGSFEGCSLSCPAYCVSKVSLNMLTKLFSKDTEGTNVKINSICPGWVRTDMGGPNAPRTIEQGISGMLWAATLDENGPNGGFFRDAKAIDW